MSSLDWRSVEDVVEFPITSAGETFYLADGPFAQSARGLRVGRGFIEGLGVRAALGRTLEGTDFQAAAIERNALLGDALWRERYAADPNIVGRTLRVDAEEAEGPESFRIVGVLPPGFYFGRDSRETVDLLVPLTTAARTYMVRLRDRVPPDIAERRITEAARKVASGLPADWTGVELDSARELYVGQVRPVLVGVAVACVLVLLVVCVNVTVLVLLRTTRRQKELAIRSALGSGGWRLARMLLLEGALVCAAATALAIVLTNLALGALAPLIEAQLGRPAPGGASSIAIDDTVLFVVGGTGAALALVLSLLPLATPWARPIADILRRDGTATTGPSMRRVRSALVTIEVAGTLVLLVGCGLMIRSVVGMLHTDLGFEPERLVRARIVLRSAGYPDAAAFSRFYRRFVEQLTASIDAPVVFSSWPPFAEHPTQTVETADPGSRAVNAGAIRVGAGYFSTMGIDLRGGRDFVDADTSGAAAAAVVSEALARRLWPDGSPLGRQLRAIEQTPAGPRTGPWHTVVGVAANVRQAYGDSELADLYVPYLPTGRFGSFYVRTEGSPDRLLPVIRAAAAEIDPHAVVDPPRSVETANRDLAGARFLTTLLGGFAAVALFLALLGIYGVTAYAVQQRERETAIRMALGAAAGAVVRMFLRDSAVVLGGGLALGLLGAAIAARVLESYLYGVRRFDLLTLSVTCAILATAGALATWWPARRAVLRSPMAALKEG